MFKLKIQAGNGGEDANDFAASLADMINKSTGQSPIVDGTSYIFNRL